MREFADILGYVGENVEGCPAPTILSHVRRAAIRVCEETLLWRHAMSPVTLSPGVPEYKYQKPQHSVVHAVLLASVNGEALERLTFDEAAWRYPAWAEAYGGLSPEEVWADTPSASVNSHVFNEVVYNENPEFVPKRNLFEDGGSPRVFTQVSTDKFTILPFPNDDKEYKLKLIYALRPTRDAKGLPENVFNELEDAIVHQAVHTLLALPNNPWTDQNMAAYHGQKARHHMSERRARANLGNARGSLTVKYNNWV